MYLRTTKANTTADGPVEYLQLCHNYYDKQTKRSKTEVIYNFGRKDLVDVATIKQLIVNLANYIAKETGEILPQLFATGCGPAVTFLGSVNLGGTWVLDHLWHRIGIANALKSVLADRLYAIPLERLIFSLVANRA